MNFPPVGSYRRVTLHLGSWCFYTTRAPCPLSIRPKVWWAVLRALCLDPNRGSQLKLFSFVTSHAQVFFGKTPTAGFFAVWLTFLPPLVVFFFPTPLSYFRRFDCPSLFGGSSVRPFLWGFFSVTYFRQIRMLLFSSCPFFLEIVEVFAFRRPCLT